MLLNPEIGTLFYLVLIIMQAGEQHINLLLKQV